MLLDLVVIGTAITLGPLHNSAFILLLSAPRGVRKGLAFLLSWLANLVAVIACVLLLTGGESPARHTAPSTGVACVKLALGAGLVLYGAHRRRRPPRPHGPRAGPPAWTTPPWSRPPGSPGCYSLGRSSVPAPRRSSPRTSPHSPTGSLAYYRLLATLSLIVMEMYGVWAPAAAGAKLNALRTWLGQHQEQLIITLSLLVGLWLMARSIYELVA